MSDNGSVGANTTEWTLLIDPDWTASENEPEPPVEAVMGAWPVDTNGTVLRFHPNPAYRPRSVDSPLDPVDGLLRLFSRGEDITVDMVAAVLADTLLEIAVDDDGAALVRAAPDGSPVVLIVTARAHATRVDVSRWRSVTTTELCESLPESGVDVLLNPGSPASMLLGAQRIRSAAGRSGVGAPWS